MTTIPTLEERRPKRPYRDFSPVVEWPFPRTKWGNCHLTATPALWRYFSQLTGEKRSRRKNKASPFWGERHPHTTVKPHHASVSAAANAQSATNGTSTSRIPSVHAQSSRRQPVEPKDSEKPVNKNNTYA